MSEIYSKDYYDNYDVGTGTVNYEYCVDLKEFIQSVADRIVVDFNPKVVLDAGCAMGHLVAALRDRGVQAYGIDISNYAISKVREDIQPYCVVGSLTDELPESLPRKYDLIISMEVLEHLYASDGEKAIQNLCSYTDQFLFCSTPDDFEDPTHLNVRQREYWARLFAENGFYDDINYRPTYLTYYASFFKRDKNWLRQIEDYERNIRLTESSYKKDVENWTKALEDKERHIHNQNAIIGAEQQEKKHIQELYAEQTSNYEHIQKLYEEQTKKYEDDQKTYEETIQSVNDELSNRIQELEHYKEHYSAAIGQREDLKRQLAEVQNAYNVISNATFWKMTKPFRVILDAIKKPFQASGRLHLVGKGMKCLKENGFHYTWRKVQDRRHHRQEYKDLAGRKQYSETELEAQRNTTFSRDVKISVVVPLYNTPPKFLREMIQSVLDQTYGNWELCMADGSDNEHGNVKSICQSYANRDGRIKYQKLDRNYGISGNTNACLDMASGDYIALFDHDDLLHPAALYEVMTAISEQDADYIYTDEATFESPDANKIITAHFKPDFAIDNLRANNYICHLSVFQKSLLEIAGAFRKEYDGSQDHDLILRLTSHANRIVHIPKILYYWRSHPQSVAMDIGAKEYAVTAGKNAVKDNLSLAGIQAEVESTRAFPTIYRIKYQIKGTPKVSIIIPNKNHYSDIKKCIKSIIALTTYANYEIIVIDNGSSEKDVLLYYNSLEKKNLAKVYYLDIPFNYSRLNNYAVEQSNGEFLILLNNDIEVITPEWIEEMLMYAQRDDVGAVGAMLYYPDDSIQHAGVILGLGKDRVAGHPFYKAPRNSIGYMGRLCYAQNMTAVTAACMMVSRSVYDEVGGLDEEYMVAYNDVDFCLKIRKAGYLIVWTPFAELYHYESKSRGLEDTPEKRIRFEGEVKRFQKRWAKELAAGDPYYNPNFTLDREDFSLRT